MTKFKLYAAILGDLCGQPYEFKKDNYNKPIRLHNPDSHITDDTIMTLASADAVLNRGSLEDTYKRWGARYSGDYYGAGFRSWLNTPKGTRNPSYGNGCLMRMSPFMYTDTPLLYAMDSLSHSHYNEQSYQAVLKLYKAYKEFPISWTTDSIKDFEKFEVEAGKTADFCINVARQYTNIQGAILRTVGCGGDTDTNASIVGELLNFKFGGITEMDVDYVESNLDYYQLSTLREFNKRFK